MNNRYEDNFIETKASLEVNNGLLMVVKSFVLNGDTADKSHC